MSRRKNLCAGINMANESRRQNPDAQPPEDGKAQALAEKFNIPLAMAKRLVGPHRAALERELQKPKKR